MVVWFNFPVIGSSPVCFCYFIYQFVTSFPVFVTMTGWNPVCICTFYLPVCYKFSWFLSHWWVEIVWFISGKWSLARYNLRSQCQDLKVCSGQYGIFCQDLLFGPGHYGMFCYVNEFACTKFVVNIYLKKVRKLQNQITLIR